MVRITDSQFNIAMKLAIERLIDNDIRENSQYADNEAESEFCIKEKAKTWRFIQRKSKASNAALWQISLKRVAAVVLATGTLLFAIAMSIEPVRAAFLDAVLTWYDDYIGINFRNEVAVQDVGTNEKHEETVYIPEYIETAMKPTYVPDGWTMECISSDDAMVAYIMYGENDEMVIFDQTPMLGENIMISNNVENIEDVLLNDATAKLFIHPNGEMNLVWSNQYTFAINGQNVDKETLVKIANSIK